jgi:hypothetical protein
LVALDLTLSDELFDVNTHAPPRWDAVRCADKKLSFAIRTDRGNKIIPIEAPRPWYFYSEHSRPPAKSMPHEQFP